MDGNFNAEEREIVKLIGFFKKKATQLINENKLDEAYSQLVGTCDKFVEQLNLHATKRQAILENKEALDKLIKDNAKCPKCLSNEFLKLTGTDKNERGLVSNKYKCRRCNIEFVWNAPNNPADMVLYVEHVIGDMKKKLEGNELSEEEKETVTEALAQMKDNLGKLKPVVTAAEQDLAELAERDKEMGNLVHTFKKHLMIEKIRMDD